MSEIQIKPTISEMEILQVLWKTGPSTVKEINAILNEKKLRGYTTTLKIMQIMAEKGLLEREAQGKVHIYKSVYSEDIIKSSVLHTMVDNVFEGAAMQLVIQTLGNYRPSGEEINELKALLAQFEENQK
ncbi:MAG: BlaI/MecI/CopY family transcriptional regulator [Saprospiraceae bacterium]|nr:BlaI/MecI/CopY family transcriptional regulator [Saprospiraceae bacterium]